MNKREYTFMLRNELLKLNKSIDNKIFMGYPYESDAKRHKTLLRALSVINRRARFSRAVEGFMDSTRFIAKMGFTLF